MLTGPSGGTGPVFNVTETGPSGWHEQHEPSSEAGQHWPNNQPGVGTQHDPKPQPATGPSGPSAIRGETGVTGHTGFFTRVGEVVERDYDYLRGKV